MPDRRLLIAVGRSVPDTDRLPFGVQLLIEAADEILVISPRLPGRLAWLASATDKATEQADRRLDAVLGQLEEMGAEPSGEIGADDPLLAFEDAIAKFAPTHILIAVRDSDRAGWQERGLIEAIYASSGLPVTVFETPG